MFRTGFAFLCILFCACTGSEKKNSNEAVAEQNSLANSFHNISLPYQLTEGNLNKPDTAYIKTALLDPFIPDSIKKLFGSPNKLHYSSLGKVQKAKAETYLIVKVNGNKKGALLVVLDKDGQSSALLPFLIPDDDAATSQVSTLDAGYSISRSITRKKDGNVSAEGKDVFVYDRSTKAFSWLVHDALDENQQVINPIDTFARHNKLSGDYMKDKKNIVSVRDGRYSNQLIVFIHTEKEDEGCKGELKGDFLITSPTTAVFRHSGDPCVLQLDFTGASVSIHEEQGCGNHRDLSCPFEGTFAKKKEIKKTIKKDKKKSP